MAADTLLSRSCSLPSSDRSAGASRTPAELGRAIARYDRLRDLPKLVALWPHEIADPTVGGRRRLVAKLRRCLREERSRGIAGHWTYDLARHRQLVSAYRIECLQLAALEKAGPPAVAR